MPSITEKLEPSISEQVRNYVTAEHARVVELLANPETVLPTSIETLRSVLVALPLHYDTHPKQCLTLVLRMPTVLLQIEGFKTLLLHNRNARETLSRDPAWGAWCYDNFSLIMRTCLNPSQSDAGKPL